MFHGLGGDGVRRRCQGRGFSDDLRIRCESPRDLKHALEETCYEVETGDNRAAREFLQSQPGVLSVEPAGAKLHLFVAPGVSVEQMKNAVAASEFRQIVPSLEDVFIGLVRKSEAHA